MSSPCPTLKIPYDTKRDALRAMLARRQDPQFAGLKRAYECPWCEQWHLTTKVKDPQGLGSR